MNQNSDNSQRYYVFLILSFRAMAKALFGPVRFFGPALREARKQQGLTQEQLAENCNIDRTAIGLWENGERIPKLDTFFKIAEGLNMEPQQLIALTLSLYHGDQKK